MKALAHIATVVGILFVFLGIPTLRYVDITALGSGSDVISSATTIQAAPSGNYTIYINKEKHPDPDTLATWMAFFEGQDVPLIMEDVSCTAVASDPAGIELATSLQSRLAENQMTLHTEEGILALSRADAGLFDVLVLSDEAADAWGAYTVAEQENVAVVHRS